MKLNFVTGFSRFFDSPLKSSMLAKAARKDIVSYQIYDLKDYTLSKHKNIDDEPFGGKPGMLLKPEPFFRAMKHINGIDGKHRIVFCGSEGRKLTQSIAKELAKDETITFLCGHFKGIDYRVIDEFATDRISIGDYIVTGGELASLVVCDAVVRLLTGVLNQSKSAETDSFEDAFLDSDYYTRPVEYEGKKVPDVLLSGNHAEIEKWTLKNKIEKTRLFRPDILKT